MKKTALVLIVALIQLKSIGQVNEDQMGAWYMYFFNTSHKKKSIGFQGDIQFRNWNLGGDLEQLLLRGGLTFKPKNAEIKFTLGYGNITTGAFGSDESTIQESRIYQEAFYPVMLGSRFYLNHRFRYEQRFVDDQDLRTRYRYNLFLNVPLNGMEITDKTIYLSLYNEIFINGQKNIGSGRSLEMFDRNRFYIAFGYAIVKSKRIQFGVMNQSTNTVSKNQIQLSFHHQF